MCDRRCAEDRRPARQARRRRRSLTGRPLPALPACRPVPLGKGMAAPAPQLRRSWAAVVPTAYQGEGKDAPAGEVRRRRTAPCTAGAVCIAGGRRRWHGSCSNSIIAQVTDLAQHSQRIADSQTPCLPPGYRRRRLPRRAARQQA